MSKDKLEKRFSFEDFQEAINAFEAANLDYFVFGGFALDAIGDQPSSHKDLDIIVPEPEEERIIQTARSLGYRAYNLGRRLYFRKETAYRVIIDALRMTNQENHYEIMGNIAKDSVSKSAFTPRTRTSLGGIEFTIMPYEWFSLYQDGKHDQQPEKTEGMKETIAKILPLCQALPILSQEQIEHPENMEKIEIK